MSKIKNFGNDSLNFIKDHQGEILITAGLVGNVVTPFFACKKALTAKSIIEDHNARRNEIENAKEICRREIQIYDINSGKDDKHYTEQKACTTADYNKYVQYLESDYKKDLFKVYAVTAGKFVKHFIIPVCTSLASTACILGGTGIMANKIGELTTSVATLTTAYAGYRERVKKAIGKEAEYKIFTNEQVEVQKYTDVDEEGNEVEKEAVIVKTDGKYDPYALLLNRYSRCYCNDIDTTLRELKLVETYVNEQLRSKGEIVLNEVLEQLGYRKTIAGAKVGWKYSDDPNEQAKYGDGYISFGIFDHVDEYGNIYSEPQALNDTWKNIRENYKRMSSRQSDTDEYEIWLHFNVDGPIVQYMDEIPGNPI